MKVLVLAHRLELGGTQVNAIELAAGLRDRHGWEVVVHAAPGPALTLLRARGLRFVAAPDVRLHPSPARIRALRALIRAEAPDLVHAWDWWQGLEAYLGSYIATGLPLVISDMMMTLTGALPRAVPTTFGFGAQKRLAEARGWRDAHLLLPPVDVVANAPGAVDGTAFRDRFGIRSDETLLVSVSRLAVGMKAAPLTGAIRVVETQGRALPLSLVIVGDGEARAELSARARDVNARLGREAILLAGAMADPRPAYAAADIVMGMGGSALRGLAFARPVIVLGEGGFARTFDAASAADFLETGLYGIGDDTRDQSALAHALATLATDPTMRARLGQEGRDFVMRHHALDRLTDDLAGICLGACAARRDRSVLDAGRTAFHYLRERRFLVASRDRV